MTATLPAGLEHKLAGATGDWVPDRFETKSAGVDAPGVWGSEYPDEEGVRTQIVAVTGVRDEVGDIIVPGAFRKTLAKLEPKVVLGHDWNRPVGMPRAIEELLPGDPRLPRTDRLGRPWPAKAGALFARTEYMLGTKDGRDAYEHAKFFGPKLAASIGYVPDEENTWHGVDPDTGLPTRFLGGDIALYEYGQVLHGAHPLAGGLPGKSGKPSRLQRKARSGGSKIRFVRDAAWWGYPVGTRIRAGMTPIGPRAQRVESAGQQPRADVGAVEIDATGGLTIKPTAKGKQKGDHAVDLAFEGIADLVRGGYDPFEDADDYTVPDDPDNPINKGEEFSPLDIMIGNAVTPAQLQAWFDNGEFAVGSVADADEDNERFRQAVPDVIDAYREKYNAELVRQNDTGDDDVPPDPDATPPTEGEAAQGDALRRQDGITGGDPADDTEAAPESSDGTTPPGDAEPAGATATGDMNDPGSLSDEQLTAEIDAARQEMRAAREGSDARARAKLKRDVFEDEQDRRQRAAEADRLTGTPTRAEVERMAGTSAGDAALKAEAMSDEELAAMDAAMDARMESVGKPGVVRGAHQAIKNERSKREAGSTANGEPESIADSGEGADQAVPGEVVPDNPEVAAGSGLSTEDGRTLLPVEPQAGEAQAFELADDTGRTLRVFELARPRDIGKPWTFDIIEPDGSRTEGTDTYSTPGSTLVAAEPAFGTTADGSQAVEGPAETLGPDELAEVSDADTPAQGGTEALDVEGVSWTPRPNRDGGTSYEAVLPDDHPYPGERGVVHPHHSGNGEWSWLIGGGVGGAEDSSGTDSYATPEDAMRAILRPDEADPDRTGAAGPRRAPLTGLTVPSSAEGGEGAGTGDIDAAQAEANRENTARIEADELTAAEEAADLAHGLTEAPDGELEVDPDVADRQDRVASLLDRAETGELDLSPDRVDDDGLRATRSDLVSEIRLQEHVEQRRRRERPLTPRQREAEAATDGSDLPGEEEAGEDAGPKPRPGVAGAAEDYADALEEGDPERVTTTRARLRASLNRSRSDSEEVARLRELFESDVTPGPEDLRAAAEAIRAEQRARRNENARTRRRVRRFERERLRSLLGQVETEMRNRNLDFDPLPDGDSDSTELIPMTVTAWTEEPDPFSPEPGLRLDGANYAATVSGPAGPDRVVTFTWAVLSEDGNTLAGGKGKVADQRAGKAAVELALEVQRNIGVLPPDALPPTGSLDTTSSATPTADVLTAVDTMRRRVTEGREVNPLTGLPDPLNERGPTLVPLAGQVFDSAEQVRVHVERLAVTEPRLNPGAIRWDTMKLSPGGAFFTAERSDERGTDVYHSASGMRYTQARLKDRMGSASGDLLRFAAILERLPDDTGHVIDWSNTDGRALVDGMKDWKRGEQSGPEALNDAAMEVLTAEKIRAGQWSHRLVARSSDGSSGHQAVTNRARLEQARKLGASLGQFIDTRPRYATADGKRTLEIVKGAATLEKMGAPDAAAVLLRRRAAELREKYEGDKARDQGAHLLDRTAEAYLSAYSPVRSPGDRVASIRPGERLYITDREGNSRSFRVLAEARSLGRYAAVRPLVDEQDGRQLYLFTSDREVRVTSDPEAYLGEANEFYSSPDDPHFLVLDRDEPEPESPEEFEARIRGEGGVIPSEVLDSAAEALPESSAETAARRATPNPVGTRAPRRNSTAAPRRRAPEPTALPPAAEENLAIAQARGLDEFYGGVSVTKAEPVPGGFESMDEVAEHLRAVVADPEAPQGGRGAAAVLRQIENDEVTLSAGGHLLIHKKTGNVAHAGTGGLIWPSAGAAREEVTAAGFDINAGMGAKVAEVFESYAFDGQVLPWSRDPRESVAGIQAAKERLGVDPTVIATRAGYLDGVLGQRTIKGKDALMLRNMIRASVSGDRTANPQALTPVGPGGVSRAYSDAWGTRARGGEDVRYVSTTKTGATLARRVMMEIHLADYIGQAAPLDVVRRLSALADELEGKKIETTDGRGGSKTLVPSDDLRKTIAAIIDANDESKPSTAARLRRSGYRGTVRPEGDVEVHTAGSTWYGSAGTRTEELLNETHDAIKNTGAGIRFYTDEQGHRHATFLDVDLVDRNAGKYRSFNEMPAVVPNVPTAGRIAVDDDGRITLEFRRENRHLVVSLPPGSWSFEPEGSAGDADTSDGAEDGSGGDLESTIRDAYRRLSVKPQDWVRLARLRAQLDGAGKEEVDATLLAMVRAGGVHLAPDSNRKVLTAEDHEAALRVAGEDNHLMAIEES